MPSFISYAAYSGCAIQIPFLWSSNPAVRSRAAGNVRANVQMIHEIAVHWKIAALLVRVPQIYGLRTAREGEENPVLKYLFVFSRNSTSNVCTKDTKSTRSSSRTNQNTSRTHGN